jgi:hypothetical protein
LFFLKLLTDDFYENLLFELRVQLFDEENIFGYLNNSNYYYMIRDNHQFPLELNFLKTTDEKMNVYLARCMKQVKKLYYHYIVMYQD